MSKAVAEEVQLIISKVLGVNVGLDSTMNSVIEWDSMAQFIILSQIEEEFSFQFNLEDLQNTLSVTGWIDATEARLNKIN